MACDLRHIHISPHPELSAPAVNTWRTGGQRTAMIDYATDWRATGACLGADPDLFFPIAVGEAARTQV